MFASQVFRVGGALWPSLVPERMERKVPVKLREPVPDVLGSSHK